MTTDWLELLIAATARAADPGGTASPEPARTAVSGSATLVQFAPFVLIFVIFYFLLIAPQRKQQKELEKMLAALKKGDRVWTTGGILGTIVDFKETEKTVALEIAPNVRITVARSHIASIRKEAVPPPAPSSSAA